MSAFVSIGDNVPVGYITPPFPSIYLPISSKGFKNSYLYDTYDIWRFTVFWTLIINVGVHVAASTVAALIQRKPQYGLIFIAFYIVYSSCEAFFSGSIIGLLLAGIYRAGSFKMNTWLPLLWAVLQIVFKIITSYSKSASVL